MAILFIYYNNFTVPILYDNLFELSISFAVPKSIIFKLEFVFLESNIIFSGFKSLKKLFYIYYR